MKRFSVPLALLLAIVALSCQETIDLDKEKKAILDVIQKESEFARDGRHEDFISLYVQDEYNTRIIFNQDSLDIITGWEKLGPFFERYKQATDEDYSWVTISKENPVIKVTGNTAWVICDNIWKGRFEGEEMKRESVQVTFLEKTDGTWKFSASVWIVKPDSEEEPEEEKDDTDEEE